MPYYNGVRGKNELAGWSFLLVWLVMYLTLSLFSGACWHYSINKWLLIAGNTKHMFFWQALLLGLIPGVGQIAVIVAFITFVASLVLL